MQSIKTRKDMAEFLAKRDWADYPLIMEQDSAGRLIIRSGGGQELCRYAYNEADFAAEMGRLSRIIARLNAIAAAADNRLLRVSAVDAAQFQEAVRRAWAVKLPGKEKIGARDGVYAVPNLPRWSVAIDGPKMTPGLVLNKAARLGLGDDLARALLGRIIKAGIMPLALVTYGKTDYDLRYRADFDRLKEFLQMPPAELEALLSPPAGSEAKGEEAAFPVDWPIIQTPPPPAGGETAKQGGERKPDGSTIDFGSSSRGNSGIGGLREGEQHQPPLAPPLRRPGSGIVTPYPPEPAAEEKPAADEDSDTEIFAEPPAHTLGTLKHKAVAAKLCHNLAVIWPGSVGTIYKFTKPINFTASEKFSWGSFNEDEVSYLNEALSYLQQADSILVEYHLPSREGAAERAKRIDVVAYYSDRRTLRIIDWKFGRIPVGIDNNPQLNGYIQRLIADFIGSDNGDKVKWIEIFIIQPNNYVAETKRKFLNKNGYLA